MKDMIGRNLRAFGKTGVGTSELESSAFLIFFNFFEIAIPGIAGESYVQFFRAFQKKMWKQIGIGIGCESGGGNKCGNDDSGKGKHNQTKT
jgi:hypothetical protein